MKGRNNCLFYALGRWVRAGFRGHVGILKKGNPFWHFAHFVGDHAYHWATEDHLPWWRQLWFQGRESEDYTGEP